MLTNSSGFSLKSLDFVASEAGRFIMAEKEEGQNCSLYGDQNTEIGRDRVRYIIQISPNDLLLQLNRLLIPNVPFTINTPVGYSLMKLIPPWFSYLSVDPNSWDQAFNTEAFLVCFIPQTVELRYLLDKATTQVKHGNRWKILRKVPLSE